MLDCCAEIVLRTEVHSLFPEQTLCSGWRQCLSLPGPISDVLAQNQVPHSTPNKSYIRPLRTISHLPQSWLTEAQTLTGIPRVRPVPRLPVREDTEAFRIPHRRPTAEMFCWNTLIASLRRNPSPRERSNQTTIPRSYNTAITHLHGGKLRRRNPPLKSPDRRRTTAGIRMILKELLYYVSNGIVEIW